MIRGKVFVVLTIYQAFIALKEVAELNRTTCENVTVIDCINNIDLDLVKIAPTLNFKLIKYNLRKSFIKQLIFSRRDVEGVLDKLDQVENLYVFNDVEPFVARLSKAVKMTNGVVVFLEEGLSVYRQIKLLSNEGVKGLFKMIASLFFGLHYTIKFANSRYLDQLRLTDPDLFLKNHPKSNIPIVKVDNDLRDLILSISSAEVNEIRDVAARVVYPAFIYIGQPLSELNITSRDDEFDVVNMLRSTCQSLGFNFYVKAHPSETKSKYTSNELIETRLPVEIFTNLLQLDRVVIASAFSSVNYNFSNFELMGNFHLYKLFGFDPGIPNMPIVNINSFGELMSIMNNAKSWLLRQSL